MGQKTNPVGFRLGINKTWDSRWFNNKQDYAPTLIADLKIRDHIYKTIPQAGVSKIIIERPSKKARVTLYAARPGMLIGKKGSDIEKLKEKLSKIAGCEVSINIVEIRKPELDARVVADGITSQLEKRISYRKAMKRAVQSALRLGAEGVRIHCSGRLGGAEIARIEAYREGRVPLHTLRSDIDYATSTAFTTYGTCGVKVWICKGEILEHDPMAQTKRLNESANR